MPTTRTQPETARSHVAGPVEREPSNRNVAGWAFVQRCLRCDAKISGADGWHGVGATVYELMDGGMTASPADGTARVPKCEPDPL